MSKIKFTVALLSSHVIILLCFAILHWTQTLFLPKTLFYLVLLAAAFTTGTTVAAMLPVVAKPGKEFALRFLVLTTIQTLAIMVILAFSWYYYRAVFKSLALQLLFVFVAQVILQSILFVYFSKKKR